MLRRHGSLALACFTLAALPGMVHAQPITSVIDVPCPFGIYGMEASVTAPQFDLSKSLGVDFQTPLAACDGALSSKGTVTVSFTTETGELKQLVQDLQQKGKTVFSAFTLEELTRKIKTTLDAVNQADTAGDCADLKSALQLMLALAAAAPVVPTPARTLGDDVWAVTVGVAPMTFDTREGRKLPAADRIDAYAYWAGVRYGVTDDLDLGLLVPAYKLDVPPTATPTGKFSGIGDLVANVLWKFATLPESRSVISLDASLTGPSGDEDKLLGTGDWTGRVGLSSDRIFGADRPRAAVFGSIWAVWREAEGTGFGARVGVDMPVLPNMGVVVGAIGEDDASDRFFADALISIRIGTTSHRTGRRVDGRATYHWPITDDGIRPDGWLLVSAQLTW